MLIIIFFFGHPTCTFQILPVNIKGLAGSIATLANWLWLQTYSWLGIVEVYICVCACACVCHVFTDMIHSLQQVPSRFTHWFLLLLLSLCHFGFLRLKEELWKRFSRRLDELCCSSMYFKLVLKPISCRKRHMQVQRSST